MAAKIVGGCLCGAVRYESAVDAVMQASCYCRDCAGSESDSKASIHRRRGSIFHEHCE